MSEKAIDEVLRCDSCQELQRLEIIHKLGVCSKCGNKRFRSLTVLSEQERNKLTQWGKHDFVKLFEPVEEADGD